MIPGNLGEGLGKWNREGRKVTPLLRGTDEQLFLWAPGDPLKGQEAVINQQLFLTG